VKANRASWGEEGLHQQGRDAQKHGDSSYFLEGGPSITLKEILEGVRPLYGGEIQKGKADQRENIHMAEGSVVKRSFRKWISRGCVDGSWT